ncbi:MAG: UDP-3-O-(3-hydroxymyristoyl)glucosamine N-acyltransferase [Bacteroidia bacterium]|nr:UDP-3-O-(3-hydroxymyristoyl)glucosamine N-acyltransferase [Bacteroidia bacterium]
MVITAGEIAKLINGKIEGDESKTINAVAKIEDAGAEDLAFLSNPKYTPNLYTTKAAVVIIGNDIVIDKPVNMTLIRHDIPYYGFCMVLDKYFNPHVKRSGIEINAFVSPKAELAEDIYVGAFTVIEENSKIGKGTQLYPQVYIGRGATIGNNCILYPGVKIYSGCIIGNNCIIHAGSVIGADGFGFAPTPDGSYAKIPQTGNVIVGDNIEIGANTCIDRATMGSTIIRKGVKLDNLVQIGHNAEIDQHTVIAAQTGVAGSTKIGKYCMIAAQVGFVGHITIADKSQFGGQSGITKSITVEGQQFAGSPTMPIKQALKARVLERQLPELELRIRALESKHKEKEQH